MLTNLGFLAIVAALESAGAPIAAESQPADGWPQNGAEPRQNGSSAGREEIVVTGMRFRGSVIGNVEPVRSMDEEDLRNYGAASLKELVDALEPETRSNSGGGGGPQIVLLNGSRIASFSDIGGLPAEAVERVDILPEQVALSYGYPVGARVLNIVLRERFRAVTGDDAVGAATAGGRESFGSDWNLVRIRLRSRLTVDASLAHDGALFESERGIAASPDPLFASGGNVAAPGTRPGSEIDPRLSAIAGSPVSIAAIPPSAASATPTLAAFAAGANRPAATDLRPFRTLLPETGRASIGMSLTEPLFARVAGTLSARLSTVRGRSGFGRAPISLLLPATSPFSPFAADVGLYGLGGDPLRRETQVTSARVSALLSGDSGLWRWSASATGEREWSTTRDTGFVDAGDAQARILAGDPGLNPFAAIAGAGLRPDPRRSSFRSGRASVDATASGPIAHMAGGDVLLSLSASAERLGFRSESGFSGAAANDLHRTQTAFGASLDAPLTRATSRIGSINANLNATVRQVPHFGWLRTWGGSLRWMPLARLTLSLSYIDDDGFPTLRELGEPAVPVPNVLIFDPLQSETVSVTRLEGGNPLLRPNNRRERKIEAILRPPGLANVTLSANYSEVDIDNPIATFPIVSPELQAAFPNRFQRDAAGRLVLIDARAITVASSHFRGLRWGLQYASQPRRGSNMRTRFGATLFDTWRFRNDIRTSAAGPILDLLHGAAVGPRGGVPRHLIEGSARLTSDKMGAILSATWQADTFSRSGAGDLFYSDKPRVSAWFFVNLGRLGGFSGLPSWIRAGRVTFSIENLLDAHLRVRDAAGITPAAFQPDYLDPLGRSIRLNFRTSISER